MKQQHPILRCMLITQDNPHIISQPIDIHQPHQHSSILIHKQAVQAKHVQYSNQLKQKAITHTSNVIEQEQQQLLSLNISIDALTDAKSLLDCNEKAASAVVRTHNDILDYSQATRGVTHLSKNKEFSFQHGRVHEQHSSVTSEYMFPSCMDVDHEVGVHHHMARPLYGQILSAPTTVLSTCTDKVC